MLDRLIFRERIAGEPRYRETCTSGSREGSRKPATVTWQGAVRLSYKSTVAVNLAMSLALAGKSVGLLDIDIHGPSIPKVLKLEGKYAEAIGEELIPVQVSENLKVMSIGFLMSDD